MKNILSTILLVVITQAPLASDLLLPQKTFDLGVSFGSRTMGAKSNYWIEPNLNIYIFKWIYFAPLVTFNLPNTASSSSYFNAVEFDVKGNSFYLPITEYGFLIGIYDNFSKYLNPYLNISYKYSQYLSDAFVARDSLGNATSDAMRFEYFNNAIPIGFGNTFTINKNINTSIRAIITPHFLTAKFLFFADTYLYKYNVISYGLAVNMNYEITTK